MVRDPSIVSPSLPHCLLTREMANSLQRQVSWKGHRLLLALHTQTDREDGISKQQVRPTDRLAPDTASVHKMPLRTLLTARSTQQTHRTVYFSFRIGAFQSSHIQSPNLSKYIYKVQLFASK